MISAALQPKANIQRKPISLRGFHIRDTGPARFLQCVAHRYMLGVNIDVPLVNTVLESTDGLQMRRLWARNPRASRVFHRYVVFFVADTVQVEENERRLWHGEMMIFRGGVRGEGLVNMRGRDDMVARCIASR